MASDMEVVWYVERSSGTAYVERPRFAVVVVSEKIPTGNSDRHRDVNALGLSMGLPIHRSQLHRSNTPRDRQESRIRTASGLVSSTLPIPVPGTNRSRSGMRAIGLSVESGNGSRLGHCAPKDRARRGCGISCGLLECPFALGRLVGRNDWIQHRRREVPHASRTRSRRPACRREASSRS